MVPYNIQETPARLLRHWSRSEQAPHEGGTLKEEKVGLKGAEYIIWFDKPSYCCFGLLRIFLLSAACSGYDIKMLKGFV